MDASISRDPRGRGAMTTPEARGAVLAKTREMKMARSAHAFVRGSTVRFYNWLDAHKAGTLPEGPAVWICGDCHLGNLGPLADAKRRVAVQIRDLDQTVIGNPAHDLIRLGLSLASAARGSDLPGVTTARIVEELVAGYQVALAGDFEDPRDRSYRPKTIQLLIARAVKRRWRQLAEERLDDAEPSIPRGKRFWRLTADERAALAALAAEDGVRAMATKLKGRSAESAVKLVDAAYWIKGCSSLGRLRYAALLRVGEGGGASHCLIDVKEATAAAAPRNPDAKMPRDNAARVVAGARALSPNLGERMMAARLLDRAVVLRELMPQDLKLEIDQMGQKEAMELARYLAGVVGRAHGRQMDPQTRQAWLADLARGQSGGQSGQIGARHWLWSSVVELMGLHEMAYLDHCRRYALADDA